MTGYKYACTARVCVCLFSDTVFPEALRVSPTLLVLFPGTQEMSKWVQPRLFYQRLDDKTRSEKCKIRFYLFIYLMPIYHLSKSCFKILCTSFTTWLGTKPAVLRAVGKKSVMLLWCTETADQWNRPQTIFPQTVSFRSDFVNVILNCFWLSSA